MDISKDHMKNILKQVKGNRKYSSISDDIIEKEISNYVRRFGADLYDEKFAVKKIRKELHRIYSSYQTKGKRKRDKYLEELKLNPDDLEVINKILSTTISCKERLDKYNWLYKKIFSITKKPKTILDLGSGLNPVSFSYMDLPSLKYYAYDIDLEDIKFLNDYFKIMKIKGLIGTAKELDIRDIEKLKKLPNSDIIFMFKTYDLIVPKGRRFRKIGEDVLKTLMNKTRYIVVSFATKTLTRKSMKLPRRIGFEMMLSRNGMKFESIEIDNEIFYVVYREK